MVHAHGPALGSPLPYWPLTIHHSALSVAADRRPHLTALITNRWIAGLLARRKVREYDGGAARRGPGG